MNRLFSYGTLRLPEIQLATYRRLLGGEPDALSGYRLTPVFIDDPAVGEISGKAMHTIARRSGRPSDRVIGLVFLLTDAELEATDSYETDAYTRIESALESGRTAHVYVGAPLG